MKKALSVILAVMMLVQLSGLALAETEEPTYTVIYTDAEGEQHELEMTSDLPFQEEGQYLVTEDVDNEYGVTASGEVSVTVDGNVTGYENGVNAYDEAEVHVTGDVTGGHEETYGSVVDADGYAVYATDDATVTIDGSASSVATGIVTLNEVNEVESQTVTHDDGSYEVHIKIEFVDTTADIIVGGDVTAVDNIGINLSGESTATVGGNVSGYDGIHLQDDATVDVAGDITATEGTGIYTTNDERSAEVIDIYNENDEWQGSYTVDDDELINHATANVDGNVTGGFAGIDACGASEISVDGNVSGGSDGIGAAVIAKGQVDIDIGGDVLSDGWAGIQVIPEYATDGTRLPDPDVKIQVDGEVRTSGAALDVNDTAEITVAGDVTSDQSTAVIIGEDGKSSTIVIGGDVNGGNPDVAKAEETPEESEPDEQQQKIDALFDDVEAEVTEPVFGTLTVTDDQTLEEKKSADGQIVVQGSINAQGDNAAYTVELFVDEDSEIETPEVPTLTVYEMNVEDGDYVDVTVQEVVERSMDDEIHTKILTVEPEEQKKTELVDAIAAAIQYIIKITQPDNGNIDMTGAKYDELSEQMVAHEGDNLSLTLKVDDGYYVKDVAAGKKATVSSAGDGAWTVTVQRGGGVTISASLALCSHDDWEVLSQKDPTCTEAGSVTRRCRTCKKQETMIVNELGHQFSETFISNNDGTHSAKCLHDGCNETLTQACDMQITETEDTRVSVCKVCQYTVTETIETEPETEPEEGESTVAPISLSAQDIETVPVQGAAFEVVDSDETLSPLEGSIDVTALQTVADKQYAVGPFKVAGNMIISFRISMIHEGNEVKLDRKIRVSIPVTEEQAAKLANSILYLCAENDNLIPISYEIIDSRIEFETDSLGTFVFIDSDVINTRN